MEGDDFNALLHALDVDSDRAAIAYRQLQQRLVRFFRLNNGSDPEALADQALDRLGRRIAASPDEVGSPQAFALGIGRHLLQEDARRQRRETEAATEWAAQSFAGHAGHEELLQALEHCMSLMRTDQRELLTSYYQGSGRQKIEGHRQLAATLAISINTMRNRIMRARIELDKCIHKTL